MTVEALVKGSQGASTIEPKSLDTLQHTPRLPKLLETTLKTHFTADHATQVISEVARFAFRKSHHISLAGIQGLSFESIARILTTEAPQNASHLAFCANTTTGNPEFLLNSLSKMLHLETVYVLTYPGAADGAEAQLAFMRGSFCIKYLCPLTTRIRIWRFVWREVRQNTASQRAETPSCGLSRLDDGLPTARSRQWLYPL